ncbi:MAG TPA: hypothetical protein VFX15_00190 [Actinomycetes bacterium]|nr:hypothetical protein [Actinomycetes bacterium]
MMTTEDLIQYHLDVSKVELMEHPVDDLTPLMLVEGADGRTTICPLDGNTHPYDMLMAISEKIRTELQPVRLSLRVDSYMTHLDPETGQRTGRRSEAVGVNVVSVETESTTMMAYERKPSGVVFEEPKTSNETDGRMIDALRSMLVTHRDPD